MTRTDTHAQAAQSGRGMDAVVAEVAGDIANAFLATSLSASAASTPLIVGIAGVPGSGKSTLAKAVAALLNNDATKQGSLSASGVIAARSGMQSGETSLNGSLATDGRGGAAILQGPPVDVGMGRVFVLGMDGYHLTRAELDGMKDPAEAHRRRGAEWTFDAARLRHDLDMLKSTGRLSAPSFDHALKDPTPNAIDIDARTTTHPFFDEATGEPLGADIRRCVVIVEGLYLCLREPAVWASVNALLDLTFFVKVPLEVATERLVRRHMAAWGVSEAEARERAAGSDYENALIVDAAADNAHVLVESVEDGAYEAAAKAASC